jgi:hypothetical protein
MAALAGSTGGPGAAGETSNPLGYWTSSLFRGGRTDDSKPAGADTAARDAREAAVIFAHSLRAGQLSDADALYVSQLVARNSSMPQEEALQKVKSTFASVQQQMQQAEQKAEEAKAKAKQAAEETRKATAYSMLWLFVSLMLGAFVGSLCATWGGRSRDKF